MNRINGSTALAEFVIAGASLCKTEVHLTGFIHLPPHVFCVSGLLQPGKAAGLEATWFPELPALAGRVSRPFFVGADVGDPD